MYNSFICDDKTFQLFKTKEFNMEKGLGIPVRIIGLILIVVGIGFAVWGYQLSGSVGSQVTQAVTGSDTDRVMTYYIIGAVGFIVGIFLLRKS
ncbi:MAG: DUF3185 family protein [Sulfurimonas sp.]|jgi:hypothetical protein|nr:DUF3185 family protein [Sulfurimonas sp.]